MYQHLEWDAIPGSVAEAREGLPAASSMVRTGAVVLAFPRSTVATQSLYPNVPRASELFGHCPDLATT